MMRSGGRRGNFRGTVESPFLRHRFTDARQDNLLPSLREAAAALCRNADRETLVEVVKLLEGERTITFCNAGSITASAPVAAVSPPRIGAGWDLLVRGRGGHDPWGHLSIIACPFPGNPSGSE